MARSRGPHPFGRSGKVDFCVLRVFRVKKYSAEGPREGVLAGDGFSQFFLRILGWGRTLGNASQPKSFSQLLRRQTSSDRSKESDDRSLLKKAVIILFSVALCEAD